MSNEAYTRSFPVRQTGVLYVVMFRDGEGTQARQRTDTPSIAFLSEREASAAVEGLSKKVPAVHWFYVQLPIFAFKNKQTLK
jgi:hypothetical protein